jgi:hypothetical protein
MRSPGLAVVAVLAVVAAAAGQERAPNGRPLYPPDALLDARTAEPADPTRWRADVVVGLPTAVRVQRRAGDTRVWFEGGGSTYLAAGGVFAGVRCDGGLFEGRRNLVLVRPGLDVYYSPVSGGGGWLVRRYHGIGAAVLDFDLHWQYRWDDRFHSSAGLKLGLGPGLVGGVVVPVPVLGLILGCQF